MKKLLLVTISIFGFLQLAHAEFLDGSTLYSRLEKDLRGEAGYETGMATGYVIGVFDALSGVVVCSPGGVSVKQVKQVVYNHMQKNPQTWNKSADISIVAALKETWPCTQN